MIITALVNNYCAMRGFRGEHDPSLLAEAADKQILLDNAVAFPSKVT